MRGFKCLCAAALFVVSAPAAWAAHAYGQFGDIKYPPGFAHFDYVNPAAPKGGEIRMVPPTRPTNFDKFNPFTLKGTPPFGIGSLMFDTLLVGNLDEPTTAYGLLAQDVAVCFSTPTGGYSVQLGYFVPPVFTEAGLAEAVATLRVTPEPRRRALARHSDHPVAM
jgi:hypothetical protein